MRILFCFLFFCFFVDKNPRNQLSITCFQFSRNIISFDTSFQGVAQDRFPLITQHGETQNSFENISSKRHSIEFCNKYQKYVIIYNVHTLHYKLSYEENVELRGIHSSFDQKVQLFKGEHQKILRKKVLN